MVDRINKIIEFIKNNKLLSLIILLMIFMLVSVILGRVRSDEETSIDPVILEMEEDYKVLAVTKDLKFYREYGKYYVLVNNINVSNEKIIRNTLGISDEIEFEIIIPGALLRNNDAFSNYYE